MSVQMASQDTENLNSKEQNSEEQKTTQLSDTLKIQTAESIVQHEWNQFQLVNNEGGRAACQGNWPTFHQMRISQFLTWTQNMLNSYARDLDNADALHRNLLTEKYARMMESTDPDYYHRELEAALPYLSAERIEKQETIIKQQVEWARDFMNRYPKLGAEMRVLTTQQDTRSTTSFETYLRGELSTYSDETLALYSDFVQDLGKNGQNLTKLTLELTVKLGGFTNLDEAESSQQNV